MQQAVLQQGGLDQAGAALAMLGLCLGGCLLWFWGGNRALDALARKRSAVARRIRPWLFLAPAGFFLTLYLIYPVLTTVWLSFHGPDGSGFVGLQNLLWLTRDEDVRLAMLNSCLWLLVVPGIATGLGLVLAALTDRIWWGGAARMLIFLPTAVSTVAAAVIWRFVYSYRPPDAAQIGLLNAIVTWAGGAPQAWIAMPFWNGFFLMAILIWTQTGFAMMLLLAALRAIPEETVEAALLDGASGVQIFWQIQAPQIGSAILAVWIAIALVVLKLFDIVLAMTNGQWNSNVLANVMFLWMFRGGGDFGRGAAVALLLMGMVVPILLWSLRAAARDRKGA